MTEPTPIDVPFEEQSTLERWIRSELYHPTERKKRAEEGLPAAIKKKSYSLAASYQEDIRKSEIEIKQWTQFLNLYHAEFRGEGTPMAQVIRALESGHDFHAVKKEGGYVAEIYGDNYFSALEEETLMKAIESVSDQYEQRFPLNES